MASADLEHVDAMSERSGVKIPFLKMTRKPNFICVVSEMGRSVNGFALYKFCSSKIVIKHLVVDEKFRRMGVATGLVTSLISKMSKKRSVIEVNVSEYNLEAQLLFKSLLFRAEEIIRDQHESEYVFRRNLN